jgi:hypothetical protein
VRKFLKLPDALLHEAALSIANAAVSHWTLGCPANRSAQAAYECEQIPMAHGIDCKRDAEV